MIAGPDRVWYRRLGIEARNVVIAIVLCLLVLAAVVGVVIGVTALTIH